jgi:NAD(P)-dependent dehydrogenase (short-subunit alcohol dehydrogenase family)
MSTLAGRVAIVLGGESGIGLAITEALASADATLAIGGVLPEAGAAAVERIGHAATFHQVDVRDAAQVEDMVAAVVAAHSRLDILVYSVGITDGFSNLLETTDDLWDAVLDINLRGCFIACRAGLRVMERQGSGRIVNVASIAALRPSSNGVSYVAAKSGMVGMTQQVAVAYAHTGITVNAICPGVIKTDIRANSQRILGPRAPDMARGVGSSPEGYKRFVPSGRRGEPQEVAALVRYLVGEEAGYVTGQAFAIDGGWSAT